MTFQEAHDLIDLLLDKADQAYFTTTEKDKFLTMAIMEWYEKVVSDYGNNPSQDHHEAAKYIVSEVKTFKDGNGSIRVHNNTSNTTPYPYNTYMGLSYPLYSIIDMRVRTSSSASWESVNPAPPGVVNDNVSDPFNKPTLTHRRYNMDGTRIQVHPNNDILNNDARITIKKTSGALSSYNILLEGSGYSTTNLVTNGDFATDLSGWNPTYNVSHDNGKAKFDITSDQQEIRQEDIDFKDGKCYQIKFTVDGGTAGEKLQVTDYITGTGGLVGADNQITLTGSQIDVAIGWKANADSVKIKIQTEAALTSAVTIDNVEVMEVPSITVLDNTATTKPLLVPITQSGSVTSVYIQNAGVGSTISSQEVLVSGSPTSSSYYLDYFKYPILSNVAGGAFNEAHENPGTSDIQLGAGSLRYGPKGFDDTATGVTNWGCGPEAAESIVKKAVRMMTANIESPLYQVNSIEEKRSE
jgi:hypothetical protein